MKIIFANNYYYLRGGAERIFFEEMRLIERHGHEVVPFSRDFAKNIHSEFSSYFPSTIEYESVGMIKKIFTAHKLIHSREAKRRFSKLLEIVKPDLVHAHNIYGRLTASIIDASRLKKIPVVMTLHDYKLVCPSYLMLYKGKPCERCKGGRFYNSVITCCHKNNLSASTVYAIESYFNMFLKKYNWVSFFICQSMFSLKKHLEAGLPAEKLVHVPNLLDVNEFEPSYKPGDYILYVGRLSHEKGIITLLKAIKSLDVQLKIVGDGPMKTECEDYVRENKINNVVFDGYKSGDELKDLFRNAAFMVVPSEWYENLPMVILEAFAYGKPVIGSDIGGVPEMVIDGKTGLLFRPGDYQELREKINYLFSKLTMITQMGKQAREKVEEEFNPELHYQRLMDVYEKVLS